MLSFKPLFINCLLAVTLCLMPKAALANYFHDKYIFGVSLIQQHAKLKESVRNRTASDSGTGIGLYMDKYIKHQYRLNSTLGYLRYSNFDVTEFVFSADYLIPVRQTFSAFVGGAAGVATQKYFDASLQDSATGSIYGFQVGGIKYLSDSYMIEIGYRQRMSDIETVIQSTPANLTKVESLNEAYVSVLLMF